MKKLAVGLAALAGLALVSTAAPAAEDASIGPRDAAWAQTNPRAPAYNTGTIRDRNAYVYDNSGYRPSTNRFHDNPSVYGNPDRD